MDNQNEQTTPKPNANPSGEVIGCSGVVIRKESAAETEANERWERWKKEIRQERAAWRQSI